MNFKEAYIEAIKNKKIRRKVWEKSIYLCMVYEHEDELIRCFREECVMFVYDISILTSDDWVIVGEDKTMIFADALTALLEGKKVRLKIWPVGCFLESTSNKKDLYMRKKCEYDFTPTFECLSSDDWEVME